MKTKFELTKSLRAYLRGGVAAAAVLLSWAQPLCSQAAPFDSPVGTAWDCVLSGGRQGIASITFSGDGSPGPGSAFTLYEFLVPKPFSFGTSSDGRSPAGDPGRGGITGNTNSVSFTNLIGEFLENGFWNFDLNGNIRGFFGEIVLGTCVTNTSITSTTVTNVDGSVTTTSHTNVTFDCSGLTNAVSFVGKVVAGKRLTLIATSGVGRTVYSGRPVLALPDISGSWYGIKKEHGRTSNEGLILTPATDPAGVLNLYDVSGAGATFTYTGKVMISQRNRFGLVMGIDPDFDVIRAVVGGFNPAKGIAHTVGWEEGSDRGLTNRISFTAIKTPAPGP